jgi:hypothetical protein
MSKASFDILYGCTTIKPQQVYRIVPDPRPPTWRDRMQSLFSLEFLDAVLDIITTVALLYSALLLVSRWLS